MNSFFSERLMSDIRSYLAEIGPYIILRNHDIEHSLRRGGDIDILVGNINKARLLLCQRFGPPLFALRRSYVEGYFYEWGHIDLTPRMEWRGAEYIGNSTLLDSAEVSDFGLNKPRLSHEALICWFASLIWGGFFKERYAYIIEQAAMDDGDCFLQVLTHAVGPKLGARLFALALERKSRQSAAIVKPIRRALWLRAFARQPLRTVRCLFSHYGREVVLRVRPTVPWFAVLGLDGSGKSTLILGLQERLRGVGLQSSVYHWRPEIIKRRGKTLEPVTEPHRAPPRHALTASVKIPLLAFDWLAGFCGPIANQRAKGSVVIFDRYHADVLADPLRYRYSAAGWWLKAALRLLPEPAAVILLDAEPEYLQLRKQETSIEAAKSIRSRYLAIIARHPNSFVIDASKDRQAVLDETFHILLATIRSFSSKQC
jgi:thymidylate kinase